MMEKVPGLDFIPAYFSGLGVFLAMMTHGGKPGGMGTGGWYATAALAEWVARRTIAKIILGIAGPTGMLRPTNRTS